MKALPTDLYSLELALTMQPSAESGRLAPTRLIQHQLDHGFSRLRFTSALESDFGHYLRVSGRLSRACLILLAIGGLLVSALIDTRWLGMPAELVGPVRLIQLWAMMPMALICVYLCLRRSASRAMDLGMILLFLTMSAGLLGQRIMAARVGFDLPLELVGASAVAMLSLSRVRFWIQAPTLCVVAVAALAVEIWQVPTTLSGHYDVFATCLLFLLALFVGYSSEYTIRWTWLNATLLSYLSRLDRLTGLLNRHALEGALENAQAHAFRERKAYAVAMIDIDAFGAYNNHYGHQQGDAALQQVADILADHARRPLDVCGRYGGEEFALLWMDCELEQAQMLAESLREVVESRRIVHERSTVTPCVTVSVGLCHVDDAQADAPLASVLREADSALFEAKRNGRNRVECLRYRPEASPDATPPVEEFGHWSDYSSAR